MAEKEIVRYDGRAVGEIRNQQGSKTFLWFQNLLRMYGEEGGFSISEGLLGEVPPDVETFIAKTDDDKRYMFRRRDFETGEKIPIYDDRFNETPPEPQYAVPKSKARKVFSD